MNKDYRDFSVSICFNYVNIENQNNYTYKPILEKISEALPIFIDKWDIQNISTKKFMLENESLELHTVIANYNEIITSGTFYSLVQFNFKKYIEDQKYIHIKLMGDSECMEWKMGSVSIDDYVNNTLFNQTNSPILKISADKKAIENIRKGCGTSGIKFYSKIFSNAADALNDKEKILYRIYDLSTKGFDLINVYDGICENIYAEYILGKLVISDNINGYISIKDKLLSSQFIREKADCIMINQYHIKQRILLSPTGFGYNSPRIRVINLMLVNQEKISELAITNLRQGSTELGFVFKYKKDNKNHNAIIQIKARLHNGKITLGESFIFLIPYLKDKTIHLKSIEYLDKLLSSDASDFYSICQKYLNYCIYNLEDKEGEDKDDILTKWFGVCVVDAKKEKDKLKRAYEKLKENLINEYEDSKAYIDFYNLSKIKPIPSIKTNNSFKPKWVSYTTTSKTVSYINNKQLNGDVKNYINEVCFSFVMPGQKTPMYSRIPLDKILDTKNNELILDKSNFINIYREQITKKGTNR